MAAFSPRIATPIGERLGAAVSLSVLALSGLFATACGAAQTAGEFPTRDELSKLAAAPTPREVFSKGAVDADSFDLSGPLPDSVDGSAVEPTTPWQKLLAEAVAEKPGLAVPSRAMDCAARQVASFVAEEGALPARPVAQFIAARCGVALGLLGMGYQSAEVEAEIKDEEIFQKWSADARNDLARALGTGNRHAGIGFARKGKRAAVAVVTTPRRAHLEPVPLVPQDGKVVLKGELLSPAESIRALVTRGRFAFETCIQDISVELPRFSVECPVSADDPSARVELAAFPAGRELGDSVVDFVVYPAGKPAAAYVRRSAEDKEAPADAAALEAALLSEINAVRKEASMTEVRVAAAQSRTAALLAPHYFAAVSGNVEATVADRVAMGLLAGWDVEGAVREGHFTSQWTARRVPSMLVEAAIASPFGRETLLDPSVSLIAIGPLVDEGSFGAVFGTYSLFEAAGKIDHTAAVVERMTKLRAKIKKAAPETVPELAVAISDAVTRLEGGASLNDTLDRVLQKSAEAVRGSRVHAFVATASSVEKLTYPSELLSKATLRLGVGVARYKPEGSPWTKLAVVFVSVDEPAVPNTARGPASIHFQ